MVNRQNCSSRWASPQQVLPNPLGDFGLLPSQNACEGAAFTSSMEFVKSVNNSDRNQSYCSGFIESGVEARLVPTEVNKQSYSSRRASPQQVLPNPLGGSGLLFSEDIVKSMYIPSQVNMLDKEE